ncbi:MAG: hypothetical protein WDM96_05010 [Lacunisphaera sp.]
MPTHFSFGNIHTEVDPARPPNHWLFLVGAAEAGSGEPVAQAKAWLQPAGLTVLDGATTARGYDVAERAYRLATGAGQKRVSVRFTAPQGVFPPGTARGRESHARRGAGRWRRGAAGAARARTHGGRRGHPLPEPHAAGRRDRELRPAVIRR